MWITVFGLDYFPKGNQEKRCTLLISSVCVLGQNGEKLMPTTRLGRVRHWLKDGEAKIVCRNPFTIQFLRKTKTHIQPIELCMDTGSRHVGVSVKNSSKEFINQQYDLLEDEKTKHDNQRKLRRARRNRKRYRKPRFNNRKKKAGWLAPTLEHKKEAMVGIINKFCNAMPIKKIYIEVGKFDTQKLKAIVEGKELPEGKDYQQGPRYNLETLREAVFVRDNFTCQCCGRKITNKDKPKFHAHHALFWQGWHGNSVDELMTVCEKCHTPANHKENGKLWGLRPKKFTDLSDAAFMNSVRWQICNKIKECNPNIDVYAVYGSDTKANRVFHNIEKTHANDAYAMGKYFPSNRCDFEHFQKRRRNNRILEKFYDARYIDTRTNEIVSAAELPNGRIKRGIWTQNLREFRGEKKSKGHRNIRKKRYPIQPGDIVEVDSKRYVSGGLGAHGNRIIIKQKSEKSQNISIKKVKLIRHTRGWIKTF